MSEFCAECNERIDGMAVCATLCTVENEEETYTVNVSEFEDWYCFDCYPPDR